jgi:putative SOS response-associated peptidase YedK
MESCTIIVTAANRVAASAHDRMPVILAPDRYRTWMNPADQDIDELQALLVPCPDDWIVGHRVGFGVNSPRNDGPTLTQPLDDANET